MIICLAQTKPVKGDIEANINSHMHFIDLAVTAHANFILFPELSLTGYEPMLTKELAITIDDSRLRAFQNRSNENKIAIALGAPLKQADGSTISLLLFSPHKEIITYSKQYLHSDEEPFFIPGKNNEVLFDEKEKAALAICYELSVTAHAEAAAKNGAKLYLASVAKTADGMSKASERLSQIARQYSMTSLVVNCLGVNDGVLCAGGTAVWNNKGTLLGKLDDNREGLLLFDTGTEKITEHYMQ